MDANGGLCVEWLQMDYGGSAVLKKSKKFKQSKKIFNGVKIVNEVKKKSEKE